MLIKVILHHLNSNMNNADLSISFILQLKENMVTEKTLIHNAKIIYFLRLTFVINQIFMLTEKILNMAFESNM